MSDPQRNEPPNHLPAPPGGWIEVPAAEQPGYDPLGPPPPNPYGPDPYAQGGYRPGGWAGRPLVANKPKSNLALAIVVTLLCCLPLGVVSIVYAAQVDAKWNAGDYSGAQRAAGQARTWAWAGIAGGILFSLVYFLIIIGSAANTTTTGY